MLNDVVTQVIGKIPFTPMKDIHVNNGDNNTNHIMLTQNGAYSAKIKSCKSLFVREHYAEQVK